MFDDRRDKMCGDHNKRMRRRESADTRNSSNTRVEDNTNADTGKKSKSRWGFKRWGKNKGTRKRTDASRSARTTESSNTIEVQAEKEKPPRKMPVWFEFYSFSILD